MNVLNCLEGLGVGSEAAGQEVEMSVQKLLYKAPKGRQLHANCTGPTLGRSSHMPHEAMLPHKLPVFAKTTCQKFLMTTSPELKSHCAGRLGAGESREVYTPWIAIQKGLQRDSPLASQPNLHCARACSFELQLCLASSFSSTLL